MPGSSRKREAPNFIVIDDNDKENVTEDEGSPSYTKINNSIYVQHISAETNGDPPKMTSSDSSDEEDCVVVEPNLTREHSHSNKWFSNGKGPMRPAYQRLKLRRKIGRSKVSDSDVVIDFNGAVRRDWEEAALRRRLANMYNASCLRGFRAERKERASVSNPTKKDGRQSSMGRRTGDTDCFKSPGDDDQANTYKVFPAGANPSYNKEEKDLGSGVDKKCCNSGILDAHIGDQPISSGGPNSSDKTGLHEASNQQDSYADLSGARSNDTEEGIFLTANVPISEGHDGHFFDGVDNAPVKEVDDNLLRESVQKPEVDDKLPRENVQKIEDVEGTWRPNDPHTENTQNAETGVNPVNGDTIAIGRERLKETEEFRQAAEKEWARRQLELQKQAQEAARERKRRKLEAERKLGMELRQRQRLEEIRQSQLKEEQTLNLKEQLRGQIHSKLEHLGATCKDMATLLGRLGIFVDGGAFPTTQQVNAAYKKALLRFHPDRMATLVKRDPSHQVEAEETFKLISRMKGILPSVATRLF